MWKKFFRNKEHLFKLWEDLLKNPENSSSYTKLKDFYNKIEMFEQGKIIEDLSCEAKRKTNDLSGEKES